MIFEIMEEKMSVDEARRLNPLVLAFLGDAVFETLVRTLLLKENSELTVHTLHVKAISYVKAHSQSNFSKILFDKLTEEEQSIYKRGRNTKSATVPKHADVQEYRAATGLEAVFGYLYLTEQKDRIKFLFDEIIRYSKEDTNES